MPRERGRPTKLTPARAKRIARAIELGLSYKDAARAGGIHPDTLESWRERGQADLEAETSTIFSRFLLQIEEACEKKAVQFLEAIEASVSKPIVVERTHIRQDAHGNQIKQIWKETRPNDVKGAFWWLERRYGDSFASRSKAEVTGSMSHDHTGDPGPRQVEVTFVRTGETRESMTDDEKAAIAAAATDGSVS